MNYIDLVILILAIISFIFDILLITAHIIVPKMRIHPGHIILLQAFLQAILNLFYIFVSTETDSNLSDTSCSTIGIIFFSIMTQTNYYFVVLSTEVYIEIKRKVIGSHTNRYRLYYTISFVVFIFFVVFGVLTDNYGHNKKLSCYVKDSTILSLIGELYFGISIFILWILFILSIRAYKNTSATVRKYLTIVGVCALIETLSIIIYLFNFFDKDHTFIIFLSIMGFFISVLWLSNKVLLREIKCKILKKKINLYSSYIKEDSCNSSLLNFSLQPLSIGNYFEINSISVLFI
jgi:hypothetical protein